MMTFSEDALLTRVLKPYKENCRYLQSASVEYRSPVLLAKGKFSIPQSCYITDTGHFNAVEFNLCYNQLAYYLLAECVQHKLLNGLKTWDIEDYSLHQLSNILIVKFSSFFQKLICSNQFNGYIEVKRTFKKEKTLYVQTACGFNDDYGGAATGSVLFVILGIG